MFTSQLKNYRRQKKDHCIIMRWLRLMTTPLSGVCALTKTSFRAVIHENQSLNSANSTQLARSVPVRRRMSLTRIARKAIAPVLVFRSH